MMPRDLFLHGQAMARTFWLIAALLALASANLGDQLTSVATRLQARVKETRDKTAAKAATAVDAGALRKANRETVDRVEALLDETDARWQPVTLEGRTRVWRLNDSSGRHACILAKGAVDASPDAVYALFADAARAKDFNEYCVECEDIDRWDATTKVSWSATKPFGPFKPRDFVTLCHFTTLRSGARCVVNRAVTHASRPEVKQYRRAEVVLAANVVAARKDGRTDLTLLTQVNPKGAIDSAVGAKITNAIVARSPGAFFDAIEQAARR